MRKHLLTTTAAMLLAFTGSAFAGMDEAKQFLDTEVKDLSTLARADQEKEMQWFIDAATPAASLLDSIRRHEMKVIFGSFELYVNGIAILAILLCAPLIFAAFLFR